MRHFLLPLFLLPFLISCEQEADIELPDTEPKIVVSCYINPDLDSIRAHISWSDPVFSSEDGQRSIDDFDVTISDGTNTGMLNFSPMTGTYVLSTTSFPLEAGVDYTLRIRSPLGDEISATTNIPQDLPQAETFSLDSSSYTNSFGETVNEYIYKTTLIDNSSAFQFYRLLYYSENSWFPGETYVTLDGQSFKDDSAIIDGRIYVEETITYFGYDGDFGQKKLVIMNCSEDYYRYHKTLQNQSFGNPFAEPALVYTNFEGGLGVFGGYRMIEFAF